MKNGDGIGKDTAAAKSESGSDRQRKPARGKSGGGGTVPGGPKIMAGGFGPGDISPRRWPGARVARILLAAHLADDLFGLVAAYAATYLIRFGVNPEPLRALLGKSAETGEGSAAYPLVYGLGATVYLPLFAAALLTMYALSGMYDGHMRLRRTPIMWNLLVANSATLVMLATYLYFGKNTWHMRGFLPLVLILNVPFTYAARRITNFAVKHIRNRDRLLYRALLVGTGKSADKLMELSREHRLKGHRVVARIPTPRTPEKATAAIAKALKKNARVSTVIVAEENLPASVGVAILDAARRNNRAVVLYTPDFFKLHNPFEYGDTLFGVPLVHYAAPGASFAPSRFRNLLSRAAAAAMLALGSPFLLLFALAIRLETPGPALFVQDRYGLGGRRFKMYKFRTMVKDAESKLEALKSENETDGALFKMHDDPRVTKVGKLFRKTSIDELPQLINIARGEMRFVGPRPLPCSDIEPYLEYWQGFRQSVPPGLTCIWQCSGRSDVGFNSMSRLDNWYALNRSWLLDARIVARTVWCVLFGSGAY